MSLCPPCREQWSAWLDFRLVEPPRLVQIGRPTVRQANTLQRLRYEKWLHIVTTQQELITDICRTHHQDTP